MTGIFFLVFLLLYWLVAEGSAVKPLYLEGLLFALPFLVFGGITYFTAAGKRTPGVSNTLTGLLIPIFAGGMFIVLFALMLFAPNSTDNPARYARTLRILTRNNARFASSPRRFRPTLRMWNSIIGSVRGLRRMRRICS